MTQMAVYRALHAGLLRVATRRNERIASVKREYLRRARTAFLSFRTIRARLLKRKNAITERVYRAHHSGGGRVKNAAADLRKLNAEMARVSGAYEYRRRALTAEAETKLMNVMTTYGREYYDTARRFAGKL